MADLMRQTIARNLKALRQANGMTQEDAANGVGVTWRAYQRWERGTTTPYYKNIEALAELYEVSPEQIMGMESIDEEPQSIEQRMGKLMREYSIIEVQVAELSAWKRDMEKRLTDLENAATPARSRG